MRRCTGLRNRHRRGIGSYARKKKGEGADSYGSYVQGRMVQSERVNGHVVGDQLRGLNVR